MRKTHNKWMTYRCPRCEESHSGYTGKLDKNNVEYVVCGATHKRMNVSNASWIKEDAISNNH